MSKLAVSIAVLVIAPLLPAQTPAGMNAPARDAAAVTSTLRQAVRIAGQPDSVYTLAERMRYWHVPGVSLALIDDHRIVYARGFGVTDFGGPRAVDTTTLFLAGSISKPVFATAALRLVEEGVLSLDEDVNAKLRSWRLPESRFTEREKVTLRRLLTHTAGLMVWGFPGYAATAALPTVQQVLDGTPPANTAPVRNDTIPGARWLYSGGGFTIAQLLTADVTGEPFAALMERLVLRPSGMTRSTFENPLPAARHADAASGHERIDTPVPGRFHTYPEMAAAGLWTTAPELARWAIALSRAYNGETGGVLSPAMARQMITKHAYVDGNRSGGAFGLGVAVEGEGDAIAFGHGGRDEGFVAHVMMWPKHGRGYVVLTNGVSSALLNEIRRAFVEQFGVTTADRPERTVAALDSAALAPLTGRYVGVLRGDTITYDVSLQGRALMVYNRYGKRWLRLWPQDDVTFFDAQNGATYVFERPDKSAAPVALRLGAGAGALRAERRDAAATKP